MPSTCPCDDLTSKSQTLATLRTTIRGLHDDLAQAEGQVVALTAECDRLRQIAADASAGRLLPAGTRLGQVIGMTRAKPMPPMCEVDLPSSPRPAPRPVATPPPAAVHCPCPGSDGIDCADGRATCAPPHRRRPTVAKSAPANQPTTPHRDRIIAALRHGPQRGLVLRGSTGGFSSGFTTAIRSLITDGVVAVDTDPDDRRVTLYRLTTQPAGTPHPRTTAAGLPVRTGSALAPDADGLTAPLPRRLLAHLRQHGLLRSNALMVAGRASRTAFYRAITELQRRNLILTFIDNAHNRAVHYRAAPTGAIA